MKQASSPTTVFLPATMVHDKAAKEAFVSGLLGGSVSEINLVTLVAPVR